MAKKMVTEKAAMKAYMKYTQYCVEQILEMPCSMDDLKAIISEDTVRQILAVAVESTKMACLGNDLYRVMNEFGLPELEKVTAVD